MTRGSSKSYEDSFPLFLPRRGRKRVATVVERKEEAQAAAAATAAEII